MPQRNIGQLMLVGVLGGILGGVMAGGWQAHAYSQGVLDGQTLVLRNAQGNRYATLANASGQSSSLFIFDGKDRSRLEVGLYEDGIPVVALQGDDHTPKALLRMAGKNQSGVLVFKDSHHRDRMIMGLDLDNPAEQPFLVTFDEKGNKKVIFGQY